MVRKNGFGIGSSFSKPDTPAAFNIHCGYNDHVKNNSKLKIKSSKLGEKSPKPSPDLKPTLRISCIS
jgi:hypothetical protein